MDEPNSQETFKANLLKDLAHWNRDHIEGFKEIIVRRLVTKPTGGKPSLSDLGDSRLEIFSAILDLREILYKRTAREIEIFKKELISRGLPKENARIRFDSWLCQVREHVADCFQDRIDVLRVAKKLHWDDASTDVSGEEIEIFQIPFDLSIGELVTDAYAEFLSEMKIPGHSLSSQEVNAKLRSNLVQQFIERCHRELGMVIGRRQICHAAGHEGTRQYNYWKAGTDRLFGQTRGASPSDDQHFREILRMDPEAFQSLLKKTIDEIKRTKWH